MKKVTIISLFVSLIASSFAFGNEVNIFNARHYKADNELYSKFTNKTGIKVNLINGKASANNRSSFCLPTILKKYS